LALAWRRRDAGWLIVWGASQTQFHVDDSLAEIRKGQIRKGCTVDWISKYFCEDLGQFLMRSTLRSSINSAIEDFGPDRFRRAALDQEMELSLSSPLS
jgi:hypothetical protein